jgi:hypothetical protein
LQNANVELFLLFFQALIFAPLAAHHTTTEPSFEALTTQVLSRSVAMPITPELCPTSVDVATHRPVAHRREARVASENAERQSICFSL